MNTVRFNEVIAADEAASLSLAEAFKQVSEANIGLPEGPTDGDIHTSDNYNWYRNGQLYAVGDIFVLAKKLKTEEGDIYPDSDKDTVIHTPNVWFDDMSGPELMTKEVVDSMAGLNEAANPALMKKYIRKVRNPKDAKKPWAIVSKTNPSKHLGTYSSEEAAKKAWPAVMKRAHMKTEGAIPPTDKWKVGSDGLSIRVMGNGNMQMKADDHLRSDIIVSRIHEMQDGENIFIERYLEPRGFNSIAPEEVGALTSAPMFTDNDSNVWAYMDYQVYSVLEELIAGDTVTWVHSKIEQKEPITEDVQPQTVKCPACGEQTTMQAKNAGDKNTCEHCKNVWYYNGEKTKSTAQPVQEAHYEGAPRDGHGRVASDDVTYSTVDAKGKITDAQDKIKKVIAVTKGRESEKYTKLVDRLVELQKLTEQMEQLEADIKDEAGREKIMELFGAEYDFATRVVRTVSNLQLVLSAQPKTNNTVKWQKVYEELANHLTPELVTMAEEIVAKNTTTGIPKPPSLKLEPFTEGVADVVKGIWNKIKDWVKGFDAKLDDVEADMKDIGIEPEVITEATDSLPAGVGETDIKSWMDREAKDHASVTPKLTPEQLRGIVMSELKKNPNFYKTKTESVKLIGDWSSLLVESAKPEMHKWIAFAAGHPTGKVVSESAGGVVVEFDDTYNHVWLPTEKKGMLWEAAGEPELEPVKAKRVLAMTDRDKDCDHSMVQYRGSMPCTGPKICKLCGTQWDAKTGKAYPQTVQESAEPEEESKAVQVFNTWQNGNITDAKEAVAQMTKGEFIDFLEHCRANGIMPYKVRPLITESTQLEALDKSNQGRGIHNNFISWYSTIVIQDDEVEVLVKANIIPAFEGQHRPVEDDKPQSRMVEPPHGTEVEILSVSSMGHTYHKDEILPEDWNNLETEALQIAAEEGIIKTHDYEGNLAAAEDAAIHPDRYQSMDEAIAAARNTVMEESSQEAGEKRKDKVSDMWQKRRARWKKNKATGNK